MNFKSLSFLNKFFQNVRRSKQRKHKYKAQSSSQQQRSSPLDKHFCGALKSGLVSGSLSAAGDCLAQALQPQSKEYEWQRTARMFGFGFVFYGPFQHFWYRGLDFYFPGHTTTNFLTKVALNQVILGPIVVSSIFVWSMALTGRWDYISQKIFKDLVPTVITGWKFWVPAACINFYLIPLDWRVLYMSCCGVLWAAYLSLASTQSS